MTQVRRQRVDRFNKMLLAFLLKISQARDTEEYGACEQWSMQDPYAQ